MTTRTSFLAGKGAQARVALDASLLRAAGEHGRRHRLEIADNRYEREQGSDQRCRAHEHGRCSARPTPRKRAAYDDPRRAAADDAAGSTGHRVARLAEQEARAQTGGRSSEDRGRKTKAPAAENCRGEHAEGDAEAERDT